MPTIIDGDLGIDKIKAGTVVEEDIAPGAVNTANIAPGAVNTANLANQSITLDKFNPNSGQLAGFRNKIINGAFQINQRSYVSGAATTAGQYTLDRWKVTGTGGVTFSTTDNKTTVTIPAGQTFQQVIEGLNLQSGDYVLSWEGSAQGRIGAGAYGNSGEVIATIVGGTDTTIEFGEGTVGNVQFELGSVATPFEGRFYGDELVLCQRYYEVMTTPVYGFDSTNSSRAIWFLKSQKEQYPLWYCKTLWHLVHTHLLMASWLIGSPALRRVSALAQPHQQNSKDRPCTN